MARHLSEPDGQKIALAIGEQPHQQSEFCLLERPTPSLVVSLCRGFHAVHFSRPA
ncbi:MAG TPA: hypothetical protein VEP30_00980 [Chthoniobacterales bacterium]|nr:hypothetical protein [Chthoniobacterales bacterium]